MKEKLLSGLKTKYSNLGLSEKSLEQVATLLSATANDENLSNVIDGAEGYLKAIQGEADKARSEKAAIQKQLDELKASGAAPKTEPQPKEDDFEAKLNAYFESKVKPLQEKLSSFEAKDTAAQRNSLIERLSKEVGIPEWRHKEGYALSADADEASIKEYLTTVKQNITTAGLDRVNRFSIDPNRQPTDEDVKDLISKMNI